MNIDYLKESISVEDLLDYYNITYKKSNHEHVKSLCPFHKEKTPSFFFNVNSKLFHCFGCGVSGDVITFVQKMENLSFLQALDFLKKFIGRPIDVVSIKPRFEKIELPQSMLIKEPIDYLKKRRIWKETIEKFELRLSLSSPYENRVIIPVYFKHKLKGFLSRSIDDNIPKEYRYLNRGPIKNYLFNYDNLESMDEVFVVEGIFDFFRLYQAGFKNSVATFGKNITKNQKLLLSQFDKVVVIPDNDEDDSNTLLTSLEDLNPDYIKLPKTVKDIDELTEEQVSFLVKTNRFSLQETITIVNVKESRL